MYPIKYEVRNSIFEVLKCLDGAALISIMFLHVNRRPNLHAETQNIELCGEILLEEFACNVMTASVHSDQG
jgi:hypothetical protein